MEVSNSLKFKEQKIDFIASKDAACHFIINLACLELLYSIYYLEAIIFVKFISMKVKKVKQLVDCLDCLFLEFESCLPVRSDLVDFA